MSSRTRYLSRDPHWVTARFRSECTAGASCVDSQLGHGAPVEVGARVFYYPATKSAYCVGCSPAVAARAERELADDDTYGTWA